MDYWVHKPFLPTLCLENDITRFPFSIKPLDIFHAFIWLATILFMSNTLLLIDHFALVKILHVHVYVQTTLSNTAYMITNRVFYNSGRILLHAQLHAQNFGFTWQLTTWIRENVVCQISVTLKYKCLTILNLSPEILDTNHCRRPFSLASRLWLLVFIQTSSLRRSIVIFIHSSSHSLSSTHTHAEFVY